MSPESVNFSYFVLIFSVFWIRANSEQIKYRLCSDDVVKNCNITEVRALPCPEASSGKPCLIKRNTTAHIEFDFIAKEGITNLTAGAAWSKGPVDLYLPGMDTNGCNSTTCPTTGQKQTFSYGVFLHRFYPKIMFDVKWRLYGDDMECCMLMQMKLK